jgi:outer membrane protein assembly factor BamE (lipoprotein component of BamABCDE complex)
MKKYLLIALAIVLLAGCVSAGRKIDQTAAEKIEKGKTTKAEVIASLGSPDHITKLGTGDTMFMYHFMKATPKAITFIPIVGAFAGGANVQTQSCMVIFGPDDIVKNFSISQGGTEAGTGLAAGSSASLPEVEANKRPK